MAIVIRIETDNATEIETFLAQAADLIRVELSTGNATGSVPFEDEVGNTVGTVAFEDEKVTR